MLSNKISGTLRVAAIGLTLLAVAQAQGPYITIPISDPSVVSAYPDVSGVNATWIGDGEIFFYNGCYTIQVTDNDDADDWPQISGTYIAWEHGSGNDCEIFFYDADEDSTIQLTNNSYHDLQPQVSGSNVAWYGYDGNDDEIFLYDADEDATIQLTDNSYDDLLPQVYGSNVVWYGYDGNDYETYLYDIAEESTVQLTDNTRTDEFPQISGTTVVWEAQIDGDWVILMRRDCGDQIRGDCNGDGSINGLDLDPFVDALSDPEQFNIDSCPLIWQCVADINCDGSINGLDVTPFVQCLTQGECPACP